MKKSLAVILTLIFTVSVGTAVFAANPFVDVPAKHWSYDAVSQLVSGGIVDGYGDGSFKGDKTMTRYEMATIVAKSMAKEDKANDEQRGLIEKLSAEYSQELENLGVRIGSLEKKAAADSVSFRGEARFRYNDLNFKDKGSVATNVLRTRLYATGKINDEWTYTGRLQSLNNLRDGDTTSVTMDNAYVQGPIAGTMVTVGRFDYKPNYGMLIDSTLNGVNFAFGDQVKVNVFYGKDNNAGIYYDADKLEMYGTSIKYSMTAKTNVVGGYYHYQDKGNSISAAHFGADEDSINVWELGFDTKFAKNLAFKAAYGASDADEQNKAAFAQVDYKGAAAKNAGSFGAWINYRDFQANAAPKTTFDGAYAYANKAANFGNNQTYGGKGYEVGFGYAPVQNALWKVQYVDVKPTNDDGAYNYRTKFFQTQIEFFF